MEYQVIKTKFGKDSIYVPFEKMLYISKGRPNEYICYQSVLSDKKKKGHESHLPCSARIRCLPNGKCERQNVYVQHTAHPNHERIGSDKQIMNEICRKAETLRIDHPHDAHRVPNRHIFQREVASVGVTNTDLSYPRKMRTIQRKKNERYPMEPTIETIKMEFAKPEIMEKYGRTLDGKAQFYIDTVAEQHFHFTAFYSDFVSEFIKKNIPVGSRRYLIDGTFANLPAGYYQLLIVTVEYQNDIFPVAYFLMNRKTPECYEAAFQFIEQKFLALEPSTIMTDYEDGLRKAIRKHWSGVDIRGCWWHFKRAVHKKCMSIGMGKLLNKSNEARLIKRMLTNIPLLPVDLIKEGYSKIKEYATKKKMFQHFEEIFTYFENYWLKQDERGTISVAGLSMRTTSSHESMNSQIQRMLPPNAHLYKFMESLRLHESIKSSDLHQLFTGNITNEHVAKKRKEDRARDEKIKSLSDKLKAGKMSAFSFLKSMSTNNDSPSVPMKSSKVTLHKVSSKSKVIKKTLNHQSSST